MTGGVRRIMKSIVILLFCFTAAFSVRYAFNSETWMHIQMLQLRMSWSSIEEAAFYGQVLDGALAAFFGGVFSTLLSLATRLSALASAAILSTAVFVGAKFGLLLSVIYGGDADFLLGHIKVTSTFFVFGWLIAAIVLFFMRRRNASKAKSED